MIDYEKTPITLPTAIYEPKLGTDAEDGNCGFCRKCTKREDGPCPYSPKVYSLPFR
jgi:hypothetical protein